MTATGYFRYPTVRGDLIAFVADDDLWLAPATGGLARRISADRAPAMYPRISPDGSLIAWTSWRDGPPDVYLASTEGGPASRVTYWSTQSTRMRGWSPAGELLVTTAANQPFGHFTWAYTIPVADGTSQFAGRRRLPFGPVSDIAMRGSAVALMSGYQEPAFWKRYRGGTAGRLWVAPTWTGEAGVSGGAGVSSDASGAPLFRRLVADLRGQFFSPMLVGDRLAFISDHEGIGNIYSCALDGTDLRRHTDHDRFYARNASTDGNQIVYQCAGDVWTLADLGQRSEPVRLEFNLGAPAAGRATRFISAQDHLDDLSCDAAGQASAVQVRGTVHWVTHRDGPARALSVIPGPTARLPRVLGNSGQVVWVIEEDGGDALEIAPADGASNGERPRRLAAGQIGWVADLKAAPDGRSVAVAARDGGLLLVDVASGDVTELTRSDGGPVTGLAYSPDSAWLAWSQPERDPLTRLRMARLADREITDVTDGRFIDTDPVFTADGQYLAFLSKRNFDPVYDAHVFDLTFPFGSRPFLVTLAAGTVSPFGPLVGGRPVGGAKESEDDKGGEGDHGGDESAAGESGSGSSESNGAPGASGSASGDSPGGAARGAASGADEKPGRTDVKPVVVDMEGLGSRIIQVPVPESRYASLRAAEGGLAWLKEPLTGNLGEGGARLDDDRPRPELEHFDIKRSRRTTLQDEVNWFEASGDGSRLVVRDGGQLFVVPANRKADPDNPDDKVTVDLSRARFLADPAALWRAAYAEAGNAMRHEFWVTDMADVDWNAVLDQYRPLLDGISTPDDFADLLHEVVAELGSSHAYINPAPRANGARQPVGILGADVEPGKDGWQVVRVVPGETSDPRARSPLTAPGMALQAGDIIMAVDGQIVDPTSGPDPLLVGAAGKPVELTVRQPGENDARRVVVIPLSDDRRLRYQDWVAGRRRLVRDLSGGRLGYLHVPDMVSEGWSDFNRDLRVEMFSEGLIIDVRANRGGHTSQLVVEKLARRIIGWDVPRNARPGSYPQDAPRGPVVALADECAGSDGDIVTAAIRILGLGPVVGTRTWGGVIGIEGWHELVDGTSMTMPKYSFWFTEYGWGVENHGVDPDVEVVMSPDAWVSGTDVQLEAAVRLALEALEQRPAAAPPDTAERPSRRRPALPPRGQSGAAQ